MVDLAHTSVPAWAEQTLVDDIDPAGREIVIVAVGDTAREIMHSWQESAQRSAIGCRPFSYDTLSEALASVYSRAARVGTRLMITGTAADCAALRAAALNLGWLDEEIRIGCTDTSQRRVKCPHCGASTLAVVQIDQELPCSGCGRNLVVYHHFSRRSGTYLGYQVDAEDGVAVALPVDAEDGVLA